MKNFRVEDMPVKVSIAKDSKSADSNEPVTVQSGTRAKDADTLSAPQQTGASSESEETEETATTEDTEEDDEESHEEVPDGTSREVLNWVGEDKQRAQAALAKEQANERPRSGLTEDLQKIVDGG